MPFNINQIDLGILVENMPDLIFYLDMEKKLLSFNAGGKRFLKMMGIVDPTPGDDVLALFPEDKHYYFRKELDKLGKGKVITFEDVFLVDDNPVYFDINLYALSAVGGVQIGFCVLLKDISDKRRAEEKYRRLFDDNPMVIYVVALRDLRVLEVNKAALKQYGHSREEFLQKTALDLRLKDDYQKLKKYLRNIHTGGGSDGPAGVWRHVLKSGQCIFMQIFLHRIRFSNEDAVMAIGENVTDKLELKRRLADERHARNQQLTKAIISAQETERAEIGRELHDNVNQILGVSRLYLSTIKTSSESQRNEIINKVSDYILDAIEEIRKLSKTLVLPMQGLQTLETSIVSLAGELMRVHEFSIKVQVEDFHLILEDKFKLNIFRIIQEQLNNVVKHANSKHISIVLMSSDNGISVDISDDGLGFDSSQPRKGIGLSNILSRTKLYNGTMKIISAPGEGCRLLIHFPFDISNSQRRFPRK